MNEFKNKLYRNEFGKSIAGVASGLSDCFEIDVTVIRLIFVLSTIFLAGVGAIVYVVIWIVAPVNNHNPFSADYQRFKQPIPGASQEADPLTSNQENMKRNSMHTGNPVFMPKNNLKSKDKSSMKLIFGVILIFIGIGKLLDHFNLFHIYDYAIEIWPVMFIFLGIFLIMKYKDQQKWSKNNPLNDKFPEEVVPQSVLKGDENIDADTQHRSEQNI